MAPLKMLTLAGAALLFVQLPLCTGDDPGDAEPSAVPAECIGPMNEARKKAGLGGFQPVTEENLKLIATGDSGVTYRIVLQDACKGEITFPDDTDLKGTFMYDGQNGGAADCGEAVRDWEEAGKSFSGPPPNYSEKKEPPYDTVGSRSFVGLFNPDPSSTVDCIYITCTAGKQKAGAGTPPGGDKAKEGPTGALLCVTYPPALTDGKAPFTDSQWSKIHSTINGSAPVSTTAALSFVLAASVLSSVFRL